MGGRGSSSGISNSNNKGGGKKPYGSQYTAVYQESNIKFVRKNSRDSETLFETMTRGRVYVTVGGNDLLQITYFDNQNRRRKTIDLSHSHNDMQPHTHHGYEHKENDSAKGAAHLTTEEKKTEEKKMVERVKKIWYNYLSRR